MNNEAFYFLGAVILRQELILLHACPQNSLSQECRMNDTLINHYKKKYEKQLLLEEDEIMY